MTENANRPGQTGGSGDGTGHQTSSPIIPQVNTIAIVTFPSETNTRPTAVALTWPALVKKLRTFAQRKTKGRGMWSPAVYKKGKAGKSLTRLNENVDQITAAVADYDEIPDYEGLTEGLRATGLAFVLHSTFRSTPEAPRCRVTIPFKKPVPVEKWRSVSANIHHALFPGADPHGDPSRAYHWPQCPPGQPSLQ